MWKLRIFVSDVYIHVHMEKRKKWDVKAEKDILVGYAEDKFSETDLYRIH